MADFFQAAPAAPNRFRTDFTLRLNLERLLPPDVFAEAAPALDRLSERAVSELPALADVAETNLPKLVQYDPWGRRIDRIEVSPAWERLVAIGQEEGLVAVPYEHAYGPYARIVQSGLMAIFDPVSAVAACPLTMSDGAAWLLRLHDPELAERYVPRLIARRGGITSGQWMTEKEGGSDVSRTSTVARQGEDGVWRLSGTKWFTSATSADIALALARPEGAEAGSAGLSLFLLELRRADGSWNGIQVRRLKDKMGTKALPTAELELVDAEAVPVGGIGRGVAKVTSLLNVARLWAAAAAPAGVGHLLTLARDYATKRVVFGRPLAHNLVHTAWLADITAEYQASLGLVMETAASLGRAEHGGNASLARLLTPLAKLSCARQGIAGLSELMESFGGAGYVEDTGIARVFRNAHVNAIWEGTTNVLAHDVVRALSRGTVGLEWVETMTERLAGVTHPALADVKPRIEAALGGVRHLVLSPEEPQSRRLAQGMARITQAVLLAEAAQWRIERHNDRSGLIAAELVTRKPLVAEISTDLDLSLLSYGQREESLAAA